MAREIKPLKEENVVFYPLTSGQAVVFEDGTNTEVTENQMNQIFNGTRPTNNND